MRLGGKSMINRHNYLDAMGIIRVNQYGKC